VALGARARRAVWARFSTSRMVEETQTLYEHWLADRVQ
jgi:hypothetical protein